jgi:fluoride exporter
LYKLLLIAVGGAIGTLARYATGTLLSPLMEKTLFPFGTMAVNLIGCFVIGVMNGYFEPRITIPQEYRLMILVGFLGGFTTFSSFGYETAALLRDKEYLYAGYNILVNNVVGIALAILGYAITRPK